MTSLATNLLLKRLIHGLLILALVAPPVLVLTPSEAVASEPLIYRDIEDRKLKELVDQLKRLIPELFELLFSFEWITNPRKFYRTLKKLFRVWYSVITELGSVLLRYINQLEKEIANTKCADQACTKLGK